MANHSKTRKKTRDAKVKKSTKSARAATKTGTSTRQAKGKRGAKARTPARATQLGRQVGAPPTDMTPPMIDDTRPVHKHGDPATAGTGTPNVPVGADADVRDSATASAPTPRVEQAVSVSGPLMQGASCTWIGRSSQANEDMATDQLLCPHCSGRLIQLSGDEKSLQLGFEAWELGVYPSADHTHPARPHPGYRGLVAWMRNQSACWPTIEQAAVSYRQATGYNVDPSL